MLGGFERGTDWGKYAAHVAENPPNALVCLGECGSRIVETLQNARVSPSSGLVLCETLPEAFAEALARTPAGGIVLLSPGAASFPEFTDFEHRGRIFMQLAADDKSDVQSE